MIYVLDGPDGAGKTTLAQALGRVTGLPVYAWHKDSTYDDYLAKLTRPTDQVWDRCFFDERVYQPVMRPHQQDRLFNQEQYGNLCRLLLGHRPMIVFCRDIIREKDDYVTPQQNRQILRSFEQFFAQPMFDGVRVLNYHAGQWGANYFANFIADPRYPIEPVVDLTRAYE